ncbi:hypothetical protein E4H12_10280 [Candidatus Thorarchaeota archaeon]|nr:MAG: hypothetical protein E4H12_10280 [Candidatus Thorarchaeota archaeon]
MTPQFTRRKYLEKAISTSHDIAQGIAMKNQTPLALCLIGGLLLIGANYTGGINTILAIFYFLHTITALAPIYLFIDILLLVLFVIAWLGGFAVILGGFLLTTSHVRSGKFIIAIATGFGLISLILAVALVIIQFGLGGLLVLTWLILHAAWALGLILTIIARSTARG